VDQAAAQKGIARVEALEAGSGLGGSLRHTGRDRGSGRCSPEAMYGGGSTDFGKQQGGGEPSVSQQKIMSALAAFIAPGSGGGEPSVWIPFVCGHSKQQFCS
jgi:hypothetical protein